MIRCIVILMSVLSLNVLTTFNSTAQAQWKHIGRANNVAALAAVNGKLYSATRDNKLLMRNFSYANERWQYIGKANNIVAMTASKGKLYAATQDHKLLMRDTVQQDAQWLQIDQANLVVAMAAYKGKLFAATRNGRLLTRGSDTNPDGWTEIGQASQVIAMAAAHGRLFAARRDRFLLMRKPVQEDIPWQVIDYADNITDFAVLNDILFAADRNGKLWVCNPCGETASRKIKGSANVRIRFEDVDSAPTVCATQVSVFKTSDGCEYRLEYNPADRVDWPIGEVAGNQGPPQRKSSSTCIPKDFLAKERSSQRKYEEQTVYFWTKEAREYAINNLWITPPGWSGAAIAYDNALLVPNVHTESGFNVACWSGISELKADGCMRAWPHEGGPKIHIKAGKASSELVAHEYGHYAAGFIFGHMNITFVPGFGVGFDILNCGHRSFNEALAEIFMSLLMHHKRYYFYITKDPISEGVPTSGSFDLKEEMTYNTGCGADDYVMGCPLVQAFHKTLWDGMWAEQKIAAADANQAMVSAFTSAVAETRGYDIYLLANKILSYLKKNNNYTISKMATEIFHDHGFDAIGAGANIAPGTRHGKGTKFLPGSQVGKDGKIGKNATIGPGAKLGDDLKAGNRLSVGRGAQVGADATIGNNVTIEKGANVGNDVTIGKGVIIREGAEVGNGVKIYADATIGKNAKIGNNVRIHSSTTIKSRASIGNDVFVGHHSTIGTNALVGNNVRIEECVAIQKYANIGHNVKITSHVTIKKNKAVSNNSTVSVFPSPANNYLLECP